VLTHLNLVQKYTELGVPSSAYVHIPFCRRRCYYCDFPVSVVGDRLRGETSNTMSHYVDVLCQEIATTTALANLGNNFFGGGTPSLLSVNQLSAILKTLERKLVSLLKQKFQ
jgi:oxygen-independent coproporphyrinogen-3 oxidase